MGSQTKTNSMHYHVQIILSTNYWFNVARVTNLLPIQRLYEYFTTIISILITPWFQHKSLSRFNFRSEEALQISENEFCICVDKSLHHCSVKRKIEKKRNACSKEKKKRYRASVCSISKRISQLHDTCPTGSLYLSPCLSSEVNDIRYCTAPGANLQLH